MTDLTENKAQETQVSSKTRPNEPKELSKATIKRRVRLQTLFAHRAYIRSVPYISDPLFRLNVVIYALGREIGEKAEAHVNQEIKKVDNKLSGIIKELEFQLEKSEISLADSQVEYTFEVDEEILVQSPLEMRFINLLEKLDVMVRLVDTLWINLLVQTPERQKINTEWQRNITKLSNQIIEFEKTVHAQAFARREKASEAAVSKAAKATKATKVKAEKAAKVTQAPEKAEKADVNTPAVTSTPSHEPASTGTAPTTA